MRRPLPAPVKVGALDAAPQLEAVGSSRTGSWSPVAPALESQDALGAASTPSDVLFPLSHSPAQPRFAPVHKLVLGGPGKHCIMDERVFAGPASRACRAVIHDDVLHRGKGR